MHPFEHKFKFLNHKLQFSKPHSTSSALGRCLSLFSDRHSKAPLTLTVLLLHHIELCCCQVARSLSGACALTELKHLVICESPAHLPAESSANWRLCTNHSYVCKSFPEISYLCNCNGKDAASVTHVRENTLHNYCKLQRQVGKAVVRRLPVYLSL